jgi:hypothetical protein
MIHMSGLLSDNYKCKTYRWVRSMLNLQRMDIHHIHHTNEHQGTHTHTRECDRCKSQHHPAIPVTASQTPQNTYPTSQDSPQTDVHFSQLPFSLSSCHYPFPTQYTHTTTIINKHTTIAHSQNTQHITIQHRWTMTQIRPVKTLYAHKQLSHST